MGTCDTTAGIPRQPAATGGGDRRLPVPVGAGAADGARGARRWPGLRVEDRWPGRVWRRVLAAALGAVTVVVYDPPAVWARGKDPSKKDLEQLNHVIGNVRWWVVGVLATLATLFLTIGGLRYLAAGGDPGEVERAKTALKSAAIGYGLAVLAPLALSILQHIVGR